MNGVEIQILGRLFDFLSAYKADELSSAASSSLITDNVRAALVALAKARAEDRVAVPAERDMNGGDSKQGKLLETQVFTVLADPTIVKSNADVLRSINNVGVEVFITAKDSRTRLVGRIKREFSKLPARERDQKYRQLLRELRPNQTEGWFKVIRRDS